MWTMLKLVFSTSISANAWRSYPRLPGRRRGGFFRNAPVQGGFGDAELAGDSRHRPAGVDHQLDGLVFELRSELPACVSHDEHSLL